MDAGNSLLYKLAFDTVSLILSANITWTRWSIDSHVKLYFLNIIAASLQTDHWTVRGLTTAVGCTRRLAV